MKKSWYSPEQVVFGLRQAKEGISAAEVCRKMGIGATTWGGSLTLIRRAGLSLWPLLSPFS